MFRIRKVHDDTAPENRRAIAAAQEILRSQFDSVPEAEIAGLPASLRDPVAKRFRSVLLVAEDRRGNIPGCALLLHAPDLRFVFLDYVSAAPKTTSRGIGGALYERVREEALALGAVGVFMECLPDDPALSPDPVIRKQNAARLGFYERFGAFPVVGTAYETPLSPNEPDPPYLVVDLLGRSEALGRKPARAIVRAILERKYASLCPPAYVDRVVASFRDEPVRLRPPRYGRKRSAPPAPAQPPRQPIALFVNDGHAIHHVRERGYVEAPVRIDSILRGLEDLGIFSRQTPRVVGLAPIEAVHDRDFVTYLRRACENVPEGQSIYPYVFPIRNAARPPKELPLRAGYYCIDTFTPLNRNAWLAALGAVDCAASGAAALVAGQHLAYALVRPPGHHAERRSFGGFCYLNSAAIATNSLSRFGKVALLDVDYHHGNGAQDIFYERADVLTVSLHGHPRHTYPYFSGYTQERGEGAGHGFNLNLPLPEGLDGPRYRKALRTALRRIQRFDPHALVVALGFDTARGDPTGSFTLTASDFRENGHLIASLAVPTLFVQEGGYRTRSLGRNARAFFEGVWQARAGLKGRAARGTNAEAGL